MSDATTETEAPQAPGPAATIDAAALENILKQINELDQNIAAASGNDTAARKAFIEKVTTDHADAVNSLVQSIVEQLKTKEAPVLVGLVNRLTEAVKTDLEPTADKWVDEEFAKNKPETTTDVGALKEQRKQQLVMFKALREVLNTFKIPNDHIPDPKRSGGGRPVGSTTGSGGGKANKERYRYFIDGKKRPPSQNTLSSLAFYATDGVPAKLNPEDPKPRKRWGTDELRTFLKENGVNFGADEAWEVTLPNDKKVSARRYTDEDIKELGLEETTEGTATPVEPTAEATASV